MIGELDSIVLTVDVTDHVLRQGDVRMVVLVHYSEAYQVEFLTLRIISPFSRLRPKSREPAVQTVLGHRF
jgi:hypothetical protein